MIKAAVLSLLVITGVVLGKGPVLNMVAQQGYEKDIAAFEEQDRKKPPKTGGVLFTGSSSIRLWKTLKEDFPEYNVLNRGFGGSHVSDCVYFAKRIVSKAAPKVIVFFAGTNDINSGKNAETVYSDYKKFVSTVREDLPETRFIYISITPAPSRKQNWPEFEKTNNLIREFSEKDKNLAFLDCYKKFLTEKGDPRPEFFVQDQLHLNEEGYKLWTAELRPLLKKVWDQK